MWRKGPEWGNHRPGVRTREKFLVAGENSCWRCGCCEIVLGGSLWGLTSALYKEWGVIISTGIRFTGRIRGLLPAPCCFLISEGWSVSAHEYFSDETQWYQGQEESLSLLYKCKLNEHSLEVYDSRKVNFSVLLMLYIVNIIINEK